MGKVQHHDMWRIALILAFGLVCPEPVWATMSDGAAADVVSVRGKGEVKQRARGWRLADVDLDLFTGDNVRTGAFSGLGILFRDRTQIRLGELSFLRVKQVGAVPASGNTVLRLDRGRAWAQTKRLDGSLLMEAPAATAAIRGTDWDLRVGAGGVTTITVLSGTVRFYNPQGSVTVNRNEAARAVPGQAPVKMIVVNPRDRVQWVTAYRAEPDRHIQAAARNGKEDRRLRAIAVLIENKAFATALARLRTMSASGVGGVGALLMLSDLLMSLGDVERAVKVARRAVQRYPGEPAARAHLARLYMITDQSDNARVELDRALADNPENREALLIHGQIARLQGDAKAARESFLMGLNANQRDDRFWYWMGVLETEREDVDPARNYLDKAITLNPDGLGYKGERGTLATFANNFRVAARNYDQALKTNPDDFVALTGRGLMKLKRGDAQAALDDFLAASLMEPRYARAQMYIGAAYYQLGMVEFALSALEMASAMDPNDPMPHFLSAIIRSDGFEAGEAITEARIAQRKMPFLKSLNQIANDQKGTANLGRAYAFAGLNEWADSAAMETYYPYWAGSHLFAADRHVGLYNKNSELFQGFLTDPTVFGGNLTTQTLFEKPGLRGQAGAVYEWVGHNSRLKRFAEARGFDNSFVPLAFMLRRETAGNERLVSFGPNYWERQNNDSNSLTAALGVKPFYGLGLFGYYSRDRGDLRYWSSDDPWDRYGTSENNRLDLGGSYKFSPTNQLWIKYGRGWYDSYVFTEFDNNNSTYDDRLSETELAARHTFDLGDRHEITWGAEDKRSNRNFEATFLQMRARSGPPRIGLPIPATVDSLDAITMRDSNDFRNAYISDRVKITPSLTLQADLHYLEYDYTQTRDNYKVERQFGQRQTTDTVKRSVARWLPRFGLQYNFAEDRLIRLAYQHWIRPSGTGSLAPLPTVGISPDDQLVYVGGEFKRLRAQVEWRWTPRTFTMAYLDHKRIRHQQLFDTEFGSLFANDDAFLKDLRAARDLANALKEGHREFGRESPDVNVLYVRPPEIGKGHATLIGFAANHLVNDRFTVFARYRYAHSRNSLHNPRVDTRYYFTPLKELPYHPTHHASIGGTWVTPHKLFLTGRLDYRSARATSRYSSEKEPAAFDGGVELLWEAPDKNAIVRIGVNRLFHPDLDPYYSAEFTVKF